MLEEDRCRIKGCSRRARSEGMCARHHWLAGEGLLALDSEERRLQCDPDDMHATETARQCLVEGCETAQDVKGLCTMHYHRKRAGAPNWYDPEPRLRPAAGMVCQISGCGRPCSAKGLCGMHYNRKRRGAPNWADPDPHKPGRQPSPQSSCQVSNCGRPAVSRGLCAPHAERKRRKDPAWDDPVPRPRPTKPEKPRRPGPVPQEVAAALAADWAIAKRVNGKTPHNSPAREVNRRFNASLVALAAAGHTYAQIAEAVGGSVHMVNKRLTKIHLSNGATPPQAEDPAQPVETCVNGHPRIAENLTHCSDGKTRCKVCRREAQARRQERLRNDPALRPQITDDMHGGHTAYRNGCRCDKCRRFHSEQSQEYNWMRRFGPGAPMGPEVRGSILSALRRTGNVVAAAAEVGVEHQAVYGAVKAVPGFGILVDQLTRAHDSASS